MKLLQTVVIIALTGAAFKSVLSEELICNLVWQTATSGGVLPSSAVAAHSDKTYIARVDLEYGWGYIGGHYNLETDEAWFPVTSDCSSASIYTSFEVLTNPHGCILAWPQGSSIEKFAVKLDSSSDSENLIGRTKIEEIWISGQVGLNLSILYVHNEDVAETTSYQVLTSFSKGLRLEMVDFEFDFSEFALKPSFLGLDVISNNADTAVTQIMTHHRNLTETLSFPITNKNDVSSNVDSCSQSIGFPSFLGASKSVSVENTYKETVVETKTIITETEVRVVKEVTVPAYSSVTICSLVSIMQDVKAPYTAVGIYTAPSLAAEDILSMLQEEGITSAYLKDGQVLINMSGVFMGSMAMKTEFYAESSDTAYNCQQVSALK